MQWLKICIYRALSLPCNKNLKWKKIQWIKSRICGITDDKKDFIPQSFRCVHCPKLQIFVNMFCTNLQSPVWSQHNYSVSLNIIVHQNDSQKIVQPSGAYFGCLGHWLTVLNKFLHIGFFYRVLMCKLTAKKLSQLFQFLNCLLFVK